MYVSDSLPPRQQDTKGKYPVVGETAPTPEALNLSTWTLTVRGLVANPIVFSWKEFDELPKMDLAADIHCVTRWTKRAATWHGVSFRVLAAIVRPLPAARFVQFVAYSERDHDSSLPLDACINEDVMFASKIDGESLTVPHGYPLRVVAPSRYHYKSVKWIKEVRFVEEDVLGFWERGPGYHNEARPYLEQRYREGNLKPEERQKLIRTGNFRPFIGEPIRSTDFSGVDFSGKDLSGIQLRFCDFRNCNLEGANLRGINLTNSDLRGAVLKGAVLDDGDVDGALFMGADLTDVSMKRVWLNATEFRRSGETDAIVTGLNLDGAHVGGLLDEQMEFLRSKGILIPTP